MIVYYDHERGYSEPRVFPYTAGDDSQHDYVDFTKHPELVESSLEDFAPIADTSAAKTFYEFLRWINGSASRLQTCDCALRLPEGHHDHSSLKLCAHGRVFVLFRDLSLNSQEQHSNWLCETLMSTLKGVDTGFTAEQGVVGFTRTPCFQKEISTTMTVFGGNISFDVDDPALGQHLMLSFWAYGNTPEDALDTLERVFRNIWKASESVSDLLKA